MDTKPDPSKLPDPVFGDFDARHQCIYAIIVAEVMAEELYRQKNERPYHLYSAVVRAELFGRLLEILSEKDWRGILSSIRLKIKVWNDEEKRKSSRPVK